jgi:eukaryotic-like serine/threonine-protein kinase
LRRQCAVRAAIVWLPIALLLMACVWLQVYRFQLAYLAAGVWLVAAALLPLYFVLALRYPARPPQDRIAGTYLVPA